MCTQTFFVVKEWLSSALRLKECRRWKKVKKGPEKEKGGRTEKEGKEEQYRELCDISRI